MITAAKKKALGKDYCIGAEAEKLKNRFFPVLGKKISIRMNSRAF